MITCVECGRVNGKGQLGTSWICTDCKVGEKLETELIDNEQEGQPIQPPPS